MQAASSSLKSTDRRRGPAGFTLAELLVVIGVVGLLLALLLPGLSLARRYARATRCLAGEREVTAALLGRAGGNGGFLPLVGSVTLPAGLTAADSLPGLLSDSSQRRYAYEELSTPFPFRQGLAPVQITILRHVAAGELSVAGTQAERAAAAESGHIALFRCPSAGDVQGEADVPAEALRVGPQGWVTQNGLPLDYAFNAGVMGFHHDATFAGRRLRGKLAGVRDASRTLLLGDADASNPASDTLTWSPPLATADGGETLAAALAPPGGAGAFARLDMRHGEKGNFAFADGHAASTHLDAEALGELRLLPPE